MLSERTCLDFDMPPVMCRQDSFEDDLLSLLICGLNVEGHGSADSILGKGILHIRPSTAQTSAVEGLGLIVHLGIGGSAPILSLSILGGMGKKVSRAGGHEISMGIDGANVQQEEG